MAKNMTGNSLVEKQRKNIIVDDDLTPEEQQENKGETKEKDAQVKVKVGCNRILEEVKDRRQKFSNTFIHVTISGSGKIVLELFNFWKQVYEGSLTATKIPASEDTSSFNNSVSSSEQPGSEQRDAADVSNEFSDKDTEKKKFSKIFGEIDHKLLLLAWPRAINTHVDISKITTCLY